MADPACLGTAALAVAGVGSAGGLAVLVLKKLGAKGEVKSEPASRTDAKSKETCERSLPGEPPWMA